MREYNQSYTGSEWCHGLSNVMKIRLKDGLGH
jgi:hypothetical protein